MEYINLKDPKHAYFFGFVQTDGTLTASSRNRGKLQIEVKERDAHILRSFQKLFPLFYSSITKRTRDTNFKKNYVSFVLSIFDMEFRNKINKLGVSYGKKSLIVAPPKGNFCEKDYIRGLIDGDGSVGITGKGVPFVSITVKSEALKNYLCDIIIKITGERKRVVRNKRDNIYNIMINREKAQKFIRYLYYPDCFTLKRKLKGAQTALKWKRPKELKKISSKFWEPIEDTYILNYSIEKACTKLERTERSIKIRLWRLKNKNAHYLRACLT